MYARACAVVHCFALCPFVATLSLLTVVELKAAEPKPSGPVDLLPRGRAVYLRSCADCHGASGEGVAGVYDFSLTGDKSVRELGGYIGHAMPEGSPDDVVGDDADAVARYIYDSFYSPLAQERLRPARLSGARLTSRQFEHALADLLADPGWTQQVINPWRYAGGLPDHLGLSVTMVDGNNWKEKIETTTESLDIDFGPDGPALPEDAKPLENDTLRYYVSGSLVAPETGRYELVVESNVAFELDLNNERLFDIRTRSIDQTRYVRSVRMLSGRAYRLGFESRIPILKNRKSKDGKQPVHSDTSSGEAEQFYVHLKWKRPAGVESPIPKRSYFKNAGYASFVSSTDMPPDDRSTGYVQAGDVSQQWVEAATRAALEIGEFAADQISHYTHTKSEQTEKRLERTTDWMVKTAERGWRRPLGDQREPFEKAFRQLAASEGLEEAVRRTMLRIVLSPKFLYREINFGEMDEHDVASWIGFTLYDSLPSKQLTDLAKKNQLRKTGTIDWLVPQIMNDVRAKSKLREFAHAWLHVDQFDDLAKSRDRFPEFTDELESDLRLSLDFFLDDVFWGEQPFFGRLMTSTEMWVNRSLADIYATSAEFADGPGQGDRWEKIWMGPKQRAGLLTHPYLMAGFSYDAETSPIHRGVFLSRSILGRLLKPPPIAVAPTSPDLAPHLTQRERVAIQTEAIACQSCHSMINPLGFSLEHFDPLGRRRERLGETPIDASGKYITKAGDEVAFNDVTELAGWVAGSREAHEAFVEQVFQFFVNQPIRAFGPDALSQLTDQFEATGGNIHVLVVDCVKLSASRSQNLVKLVAN